MRCILRYARVRARAVAANFQKRQHVPQAPASTSYKSLYSFGKGSDGQEPKAGLIDVNGTLYGTT
jgi:hypothetical protein